MRKNENEVTMNARQAHEKAISETIRICKENGVLQEYFEENEEQVMGYYDVFI